MKKTIILFLGLAILFASLILIKFKIAKGLALLPDSFWRETGKKNIGKADLISPVPENFKNPKFFPKDEIILEESDSASDSKNGQWWVNSGGLAFLKDNGGRTILGNLKENEKWREIYAQTNPGDTENGSRPQNIFRLVSKLQKKDFSQSAYFKIEKYSDSDSFNRNSSNGVLFFSRYYDQNNTYYAGVRVDGNAVIKKKKGGIYEILTLNPVFGGFSDSISNKNLIPSNFWVGIKSETVNEIYRVRVRLYLDIGNGWFLAAEAFDQKSPFWEEGFYGIRSDFMDLQWKEYNISEQ